MRLGSIVLVIAAAMGCDDPYQPPCRLTGRAVLVSDPSIASTVALARDRGLVVASWARREEADAGGTPAIQSFEVAVVDERGLLGPRTTVPVPEALRTRRGSVRDAGVVVEDGAVLVHWIATETTTDREGRVRTAAALNVSYGGAPVVVASCKQCVMTTAAVSLGTESIVLVQTEPERDSPGAPALRAFRLERDGSSVREATPWLVAPQPIADGEERVPQTLAIEADDEGVSIIAGDRAWLADRALRLLRGPIALPDAAGVGVSWEGTETSIAWSVSPFDDGRAVAPEARREIFTGLVVDGLLTRERVSRGGGVVGFDRRERELGVLFASASRMYFAKLDPHGRKSGGDVPLGSLQPGGGQVSALLARGGGLFTTVTLGAGQLVSSEVRCAP